MKKATLTILFAAVSLCSAFGQVHLTLDGTTVVKPSFYAANPATNAGGGGITLGMTLNTAAAGNDYRLVRGVQKVDSIAALRALPVPVDGQDSGQIALRGYYAPGDGGGGNFYWDANYTYLQPLTVTMGTAGSQYQVHDLLNLNGGTAYSSAFVDVLSVDANGAVVSYAVLPGSSYSVLPVGLQQTTVRGTGTSRFPTGATFRFNTCKNDDGGACVCPSGYHGAGRWRRVLEPGARRNILCWGAQPSVAYGTGVDSYDAINAAIASLPDADFSAQEYPGAGCTGHQKQGVIYFPPAPADVSYFGYEMRDTLYVSCTMSLRGEVGKSRIGFINDVAPSAGSPKWVIRCLYSVSSNNTFYIDIEGLCVTGRNNFGNPGASGIYYIGCNGGRLVDCTAERIGVKAFFVDSAGCYINNLRTDNVQVGPGLTIIGQQAICGYLDIEHVNYALPGGTINYDASDGYNDPFPAVLLSCTSSHIQEITTESSTLPLKFIHAFGTTVESLHSNNGGDTVTNQASPSTASIIKAYGSDHITINSIVEQGSASWPFYVRDIGNGSGDSFYHGDGVGARGTYTSLIHASSITVDSLTVGGGSLFRLPPTFYSSDQQASDQLSLSGFNGSWSFSRKGGGGGPSAHPTLGLDYFDRVSSPAGFITPVYYLTSGSAFSTLSVDALTHNLLYTNSSDNVSRRVLTANSQDSLVVNGYIDAGTSFNVGSTVTSSGQIYDPDHLGIVTGGDLEVVTGGATYFDNSVHFNDDMHFATGIGETLSLLGSLSADQGTISSDGTGNFSVYHALSADNIYASTSFSSDSNQISSDGDGTLTVFELDSTNANTGDTYTGSLTTGPNGTVVNLHRIVHATLVSGTVLINDASITDHSTCTPTNTPYGYSGPIGSVYVASEAVGQVRITSTNPSAANNISVTIENE